VKYQLFFSDFNESSVFSADFRKSYSQMSNFLKIRPVRAELFCDVGQTDMTKLIVASRNFAKVSLM